MNKNAINTAIESMIIDVPFPTYKWSAEFETEQDYYNCVYNHLGESLMQIVGNKILVYHPSDIYRPYGYIYFWLCYDHNTKMFYCLMHDPEYSFKNTRKILFKHKVFLKLIKKIDYYIHFMTKHNKRNYLL